MTCVLTDNLDKQTHSAGVAKLVNATDLNGKLSARMETCGVEPLKFGES